MVYSKIILWHSPLGKGETDSLYAKHQTASRCSEWSTYHERYRYGNLLEGRRKTTGFVVSCKTVELCLVPNRMQFAWTGVKGSRPGRTGVTVLPRGDIGDLRRALATVQGR